MRPAAEPDRYTCQEGRLPFLLTNVGVLNLSISSLYLQVVMNGRDRVGEEAPQLVISAISEMVPSASSLKTQLWASMISSLPPRQRILVCLVPLGWCNKLLTSAQFRDKAESEFFALLASRTELQVQEFQTLTQCLMSCMSRADEDKYTAISATRIMVQIQENLARLMAALHSLRERRPLGERLASIANNAEESVICLK